MPLVLAADYPSFFQILWTTLMFFLFVAWIWVLISVFSDLFRRHDMGGFMKAIWAIGLIFLPFLGVLIYLIAYGNDMAKRNAEQVIEAQKQFDAHVKSVAGGSAAEIAHAKELLDAGTITQAEFDTIKAKALAS
ncbi:SHOCT domain-containing protein [Svornostia abyssi]|uniref:SHOCT domain-containing protein n=1 Tax=Svornostia abyssi TaxID=2898438 RepID=A0ABY5PDX7_9ACTN|nr:SHOCT domain-containing protein [Parviterribacteraceae bacterium J379]